eukprot:scaffold75923_cov33-Tisochrysis_lutea.AAC.3
MTVPLSWQRPALTHPGPRQSAVGLAERSDPAELSPLSALPYQCGPRARAPTTLAGRSSQPLRSDPIPSQGGGEIAADQDRRRG